MQLVDGKKLTSNEQVDIDLRLQGDEDTIYHIKPYVINGMSTELILRIDFLTANHTKINCSNMKITIDDKVYEFEDVLKPSDPDIELSEKTRIFQIKTNENVVTLKETMNEFKRQMPSLGRIFNVNTKSY